MQFGFQSLGDGAQFGTRNPEFRDLGCFFATSNKSHASSNKCLTSSNKKLVELNLKLN